MKSLVPMRSSPGCHALGGVSLPLAQSQGGSYPSPTLTAPARNHRPRTRSRTSVVSSSSFNNTHQHTPCFKLLRHARPFCSGFGRLQPRKDKAWHMRPLLDSNSSSVLGVRSALPDLASAAEAASSSAPSSSSSSTLLSIFHKALHSLPTADFLSSAYTTGVPTAAHRLQEGASAAWGAASATAQSLADQASSALQASASAASAAVAAPALALEAAAGRGAAAVAASVAASSADAAAAAAASGPPSDSVENLLSSEQNLVRDFGDVVRLMAADSSSALQGAAAGVTSAVGDAPSVVHLEAAGSRASQGAAVLLSRAEAAAQSWGEMDPGVILSSLTTSLQAAPEAVGNAVVSGLAQVAATPGAAPVLSAVAATVAGLLYANVAAALREARGKGKELPRRYDPDAIAAYFKLRPLTVLARSASVFAQVSELVASIYVDRARGLEKANERLRARQTVELITRLGPTAIKVGQALSIRPDLLSVAYLEELQSLQDRVASFSNEEAKEIIREGLGKPAEELFSDMSPFPVAAASLGQVYKARLRKTGEEVAIKVQRPGVLEGICCDLLVLRAMALTLQRLPNVHTDLLDVLDTWARRFFDELDYIQEGKNAIRFAKDMEDIPNIVVPPVFMEYTSRKVLTTGWVEGEKLCDCVSSDLGTLVSTALNCYLIQLLETGFLHADPHPGNLLRTPDGHLCVLDFGLMTEVTRDQQYALIEYISHLVNSDFERVAEDLVVLGFVPPELVDPEKTAAVVPKLSRVLGQLTQGGGARKINVAQVTDDLAQLSAEYVFVIPPYFALILRAFGVLEGIGLDHDPDYTIVDECYPYISKRLLTDDSPRARKALRYFLYGKEDRLDVTRVEELAQGVLTFRELMAAGAAPKDPAMEAAGAEGLVEAVEGGVRWTREDRRSIVGEVSAVTGDVLARRALPPATSGGSKRKPVVDPTARQVLASVFAVQGSYLQELLLTELVKTVDAFSREVLAEQWSLVAARSFLPVPPALQQPGSYPLPLLLPGAISRLVRGEWRTASLSEEDQATLSTVRRLWAFLEPQLEASDLGPFGLSTPQDVLPRAQEFVPVLRELLPGVATTSARFVLMLMQRQALRLADDLDGGQSVALWDADPYSFARLLQPGSRKHS